MAKDNTNKINNLNVLYFIVILLLIIGHCIQTGSGEAYDNFGNVLFKAIYAFHVPLFTMIFGYLLYDDTTKHEEKEVAKKSFNTFIMPLIGYSLLELLWELLEKTLTIHNIPVIAKTFIQLLLETQWFIRGMFILTIIVLIVKKYFKDSIYIYLLILILTLFLPSDHGLSLYGFTYPYFVIGYLANKEKLISKIKNPKWVCLISTVLYFALLTQYNKDCYIYTTGLNVLNSPNQIWIDIYRFIIGLLGCISVVSFVKLLNVKKLHPIVETISNNWFQIYLVSNVLFRFLDKITSKLSGLNILLLLIEIIVMIVLSLIIIKICKKNKILSRMLLGI